MFHLHRAEISLQFFATTGTLQSRLIRLRRLFIAAINVREQDTRNDVSLDTDELELSLIERVRNAPFRFNRDDRPPN